MSDSHAKTFLQFRSAYERGDNATCLSSSPPQPPAPTAVIENGGTDCNHDRSDISKSNG